MGKKAVQLTDGQNDILPICAEVGNGYIKFADGTLICYGRSTWHSGESAVQAEGNLYSVIINMNMTFPIEFISMPSVIINNSFPADTDAQATFVGNIYVSTTGISKIKFMRATAGTAYFNISWIAIGRWRS